MKYPNLSKAPIVEAVIEIRMTIKNEWNDSAIKDTITERLPDYPKIEEQRRFEHKVSIRPNQEPQQNLSDLGLKGFRLISKNKEYVVQFNKDSFVFSRLYPYENWKRFSDEAIRLWSLYINIIGDVTINRIGVRFINKISMPKGDLNFGEYLENPPNTPDDIQFPFIGFFHQDTLLEPETGCNINLIKTIQQSENDLHLIIDIDVFTIKMRSYSNEDFIDILEEMRTIKNKIFFNNITKKTLELLK